MSLHCSKRTVSGALNVQKTRPRMVTTLHVGKFYACEAIGVCHRCDRIHHSEQLRKLVPPGANSGYDVLVYVGKALYLNHCSEEEVVTQLAQKNSRHYRRLTLLGNSVLTP